MNSPIWRLGRRVEDDDHFLAPLLGIVARSEGIDEMGLAQALGCSLSGLGALRLCRRPRPEPPEFEADVARISSFVGARADVLAQFVRHADALTAFRQIESASSGMLLAARDRSELEDLEGSDAGAPG